MTIWEEVKEKKPLPLVWTVGSLIVVAVALFLFIFKSTFGTLGGWLLLGIFFVGAALALAASVEPGNRGKVWGELGRSLLVAGLLAFAAWMIGELRRPVEEHSALQATLGFQQNMPGVDLHAKDLDRFDLSGRNLEGANLADALLRDTSLVGANLKGANLASANLSGANLEEADFSGADLSEAELVDVEAERVDMQGARMPGADLSGAELSGANLKGVCLAGGTLVGASLPDAHLERAALTGADLEGTTFWFDLRPTYLAAVGLDGAKHALEARWPPGFEQRAKELATPDDYSSPAAAVAPARGTGSGRVLAVPDGDTALLATPTGRKAVRLIGIDAPDLGEAGGGSARDALRKLLPHDARVRFAYDERRADAFDRELLYLYGPGGTLVNQELLLLGVVVANVDPPGKGKGLRNARYARQLIAAESWARQHSVGLWETCPP